MSVINQMLKELKQPTMVDWPPSSVPATDFAKKQRKHIPVLLSAAFALTLTTIYIQTTRHSANAAIDTRTPLSLQIPVDTRPVLVTEPAAAEQAQDPIPATSEKLTIPVHYIPTRTDSTLAIAASAQTIRPTSRRFDIEQMKAALFRHDIDARERWQQHLLSYPQDSNAQLIWLSYWSQQDTTRAENFAITALQHNADHIELRQMLAQIYWQNKQFDSTIATLQSRQPALSTAPDYYALLAQTYLQKQQFSLAAQWYRALIDRFPQNGRYWAGLASSAQGLQQTSEERHAWQQALLDPALHATLRAYALQRLQQDAQL